MAQWFDCENPRCGKLVRRDWENPSCYTIAAPSHSPGLGPRLVGQPNATLMVECCSRECAIQWLQAAEG